MLQYPYALLMTSVLGNRTLHLCIIHLIGYRVAHEVLLLKCRLTIQWLGISHKRRNTFSGEHTRKFRLVEAIELLLIVSHDIQVIRMQGYRLTPYQGSYTLDGSEEFIQQHPVFVATACLFVQAFEL